MSAYYYPPPMTRSYGYAPRVYRESYAYGQPTYSEQYAQQPSGAQSYSAARPAYAEQRPTTTVTVGDYDNRFEPRTINVQPGTTVRWVNQGQHAHTVTAHNRSWDSGDIPPGQSYSATFKRPGTYTYFCSHHAGMEGRIVVGAEEAKTARRNGSAQSDGNGAARPPASGRSGGQNGASKSPGY